MQENPLRIAINAQILPNTGVGGVESVLKDLIFQLGKLTDADEEYLVITHWQNNSWIKPFLGPNQKLISGPQPSWAKRWYLSFPDSMKSSVSKFRSFILRKRRQWPEIPVSSGFYEALDCDVIHFPSQEFVYCAIPSLYNPHDLQHKHYPQFFPPSLLAWRESIYPGACRLANVVVAGTEWVKQDISRQYGTAPEKIQVVPWAAPNEKQAHPSDDLVRLVKSQYNLNTPFAFYPAMTWEHKNHARLLNALAYLRDKENFVVQLVCTGYKYPLYWPRLEQMIVDLSLQNQVKFLGIVPEDHLRAIFRLSQFVIVPTLFEAASGPVLEAWQESVPVACSTVTSLPEQVGDAGLLFDPFSIESIGKAIQSLASDVSLRQTLIAKGHQRLAKFSWEKTAKAYRALYRRTANRKLSDEDKWLLNHNWTTE